MLSLSVGEAAEIVHGEVRGDLGVPFEGVCTDTREETAGRLFVALKGERSDGHSYLGTAAERACAAALVSTPEPGLPIPQIVVSSPLAALGALAARHRSKFCLPVVAITGSVGKTTTKEMASLALSSLGTVLTSPGNFNNEIGLPRTMAELDSSHAAAVLEMGMRGPGQIAELASIAMPRVGIVTNVGVSHIELLGSRDAIAKAKAELVEGLPPDGCAVLPADDDFLDLLRSVAPCEVRTFGASEGADYRVESASLAASGGTQFVLNGRRARLSQPGHHLAWNAAAACASAEFLGVPQEEAIGGIERYLPGRGRLRTVLGLNEILILDDTYNAAPDSMRAALQALRDLARRDGRRAVAVLGEMRELGGFSEELHAAVGAAAAENGIDLLASVGAGAEPIAGAYEAKRQGGECIRLSGTQEAAERIGGLVRPGDAVLVKGSRAMAMETIVEALEDESLNAP